MNIKIGWFGILQIIFLLAVALCLWLSFNLIGYQGTEHATGAGMLLFVFGLPVVAFLSLIILVKSIFSLKILNKIDWVIFVLSIIFLLIPVFLLGYQLITRIG
ncbi:MAG: hypothetical protein WCG28_01160 [bacterium]